MTEATGGTGGTGGTDSGAGVGGAGAGVSSGGVGNSAGGGTPGGAPGAAPAWYESVTQDAEARTWIQTKGWQDHNAMIASHRSLEKLIGVDPKSVVRIPKAGDLEGQNAFYKQLGRPDTADKYDLGEGLDPAYAGAAKEFFHKAGLSNEQAKAVVAANNEYLAGMREQQAKDYQLGVEAGEQQLQNEWRGGYDRMINQATQTAKMLGFTAEMIDGLESKMGYADTLKFLANLGNKISEDSFVSADGGKKQFAGTLTPQEATREWDQLKLDQNFLKALMDGDNPGHKAARDKQTRLFQIMFPQ